MTELHETREVNLSARDFVGFDAALAWLVSKYETELGGASAMTFHVQKMAVMKDPTEPVSLDNVDFKWVATAQGSWYPKEDLTLGAATQ